MCLIIEKTVEQKVATEDIHAFKALEGGMVSPIQRLQYIADKLYETEMQETEEMICSDNVAEEYLRNKYSDWTKNSLLKSIGRGFHALTTLGRANSYMKTSHSSYVYPCIIPKGSLYYISETQEIVSNKIIIKDEI